jgi:hypothetical protein
MVAMSATANFLTLLDYAIHSPVILSSHLRYNWTGLERVFFDVFETLH